MENENLIDKLHEADMLYFVLGSLISADSLVDIDACHKALNCLENLKWDFETSKLKDDPKLRPYLENAESIIKRDMENFKETILPPAKLYLFYSRPIGVENLTLEISVIQSIRLSIIP